MAGSSATTASEALVVTFCTIIGSCVVSIHLPYMRAGKIPPAALNGPWTVSATPTSDLAPDQSESAMNGNKQCWWITPR
ncbi:hypothetical protein HBI56_009280 [Parastagonospora nodorum]|uniref:Uncharacterized protein n=1 Tax=Phaeosphaeria nodorum (strain SN15 / ATCC MYA-4574 / FGSC 10173) TaxID=321614 RepID=A0A7U2EQ31_PHANO|nr:hypothetical protein HBH56_236750 [Parastagonospora nodorum]QRC90895.1 hypothetical protein JI435_426070 [Parastagonospora nodorum SN15]KAH3935075.1 hypothetical protein HBH54_045980 [Parastagonospora nodorum]KAH3950278.1 hypothetical protein HBH53_077980 [Parastagonospora nodorum]KAH3986926.1 hypothetical protein HBH51_011030 [Parastagonospora nodorum]